MTSSSNGSDPGAVMDADETRLDDPALWSDDTSKPLWANGADLMLRQLAGAGAQVREATALASEAGLHVLGGEGRPRALVVAGVGTAARTGEILSAVAGPGCPVPVMAHRSAGVPGWVGAADVVVAVSASGKSPEALAAADAAMHRGARLVAVGAAESPLHALAERARALFVPVPPRRPARINLWALTVPVLLTARSLGLIDITEADLAETAARLDADADRCRASADTVTNEGKALALGLVNTIPVVWGSSRLAGVAAARFVDQLAANARYPAIAGALVEASRGRIGMLDGIFGAHGWTEDDFFADRDEESTATRLRLVLLRDEGASPNNVRRAEHVADMAASRNIPVSVVAAEGVSKLERLASLIAVPDFASVYLGALHGIDPIAVPAVTDLKDRMAEPE